jgi:uncharacterized protein (DUF1778 family)
VNDSLAGENDELTPDARAILEQAKLLSRADLEKLILKLAIQKAQRDLEDAESVLRKVEEAKRAGGK